MSSNIFVTVYEGLKAPCGNILEFLDSLEFVPAQHDPRWSQVYAKLDNEEFYIIVAHENGNIVGVSNFTVFNGPMGSIIHANPYMGYGGCSCAPQKEIEVIHALMTALLKWAQKSGCITASVGTPPFNEKLHDSYIAEFKPDYIYKKFYQYNYLDQHPVEKIGSRHRQRILNEIRLAESSQVKVTWATDRAQVEAWCDIYEEHHIRIGARPIPRELHLGIWDTFGTVGRAPLNLAYKGEQLLGGVMFVIGRGIVDAFSAGFNSEGMDLHAGVLTYNKAFNTFLEAGTQRFNWQSSPSRDSGVYKFKKRWGALEGQYLILTKVLGNAEVFTSKTLSEVRDAYGAHFVLPYSLWEKK